ncbi:hypothetical protein H2203_008797 [Taxawa tesnikishii (nom. ined.)]|nr:hypothetical protein H2203_008797 [Dothideales sp. JES 119]
MESLYRIQEHLPTTVADLVTQYTKTTPDGTYPDKDEFDLAGAFRPSPSFLRVYLYVGDTSTAFWAPPSNSQDPLNTNLIRNVETAPGLAFIAEVERRCGLKAGRDTDRLKGKVDQRLVADFIDSHPYFSNASFKPSEREVYREKLAFYFIKKAGYKGLVAAVDVVASATCLVAECIVRRSPCHTISVMNSAEVFFCVSEETETAMDILDHVRRSLAKACTHTVVSSSQL